MMSVQVWKLTHFLCPGNFLFIGRKQQGDVLLWIADQRHLEQLSDGAIENRNESKVELYLAQAKPASTIELARVMQLLYSASMHAMLTTRTHGATHVSSIQNINQPCRLR